MLAEQLQAVLPNAPEIVMIAVDSSNVSAIGYNSINQVLQVNFHSASRYRYFQVPLEVFEAFLNADSKGRYLNYHVKGRYGYEGLIKELVEVGISQMDIQPTGIEAVLLQDGGAEFSLSSGAAGCWITVDSLSVYLKRDAGRLVVEVFSLDQEDEEVIAALEVENSTPF